MKHKLILFAAGIAAAACSPLAPRPNYSKFFTLTPISDGSSFPPGSVSTTSSQLAIGAGPVDFPGYLRRSQVVTRSAPNQLHLSAEDRWGEPLDKNFKRVLSENLARLLNTYRIEEYPWSHEAHVDYQIAIQVQNFENTSDGQSLLRARWIIKDGVSGRDLYASETTANTPVGASDSGGSEALSSDLATLSRAIASQVKELSHGNAANRATGTRAATALRQLQPPDPSVIPIPVASELADTSAGVDAKRSRRGN